MAFYSVHGKVREMEQAYLRGSVILGNYLTWSMYNTVETIQAYLQSKHTSGSHDSLGREKPFFNIVTAAVNIWFRATDIDRKNIKFVATKSSSVVLSMIANVLLQRWMQENNFGQWLNDWGRTLSQYGSAVTKFVEQDGELVPSIVHWRRVIPDAIDFTSSPRIEKFYKNQGQLIAMATPGHPDYKGYDMDTVRELLDALQPRKTLSYQQQDNLDDFIELYEVHGLMDTRLLEDDPDWNLPDEKAKYCQQMHVISFVHSEGNGETDQDFDDFTLYKGRERHDPYELTHLIEEEGRTMAIGAVEYLFDAQWMVNHSVKTMKDTLDLASRVIFQTADEQFIGRNVLTSIETGDIFIHAPDQPLQRVANDSPDIMAFNQYAQMWQTMAQELTATPDAMRGVRPTGNAPYALEALLTQQAGSLFQMMTQNKGLALEKILRRFVIPHLQKKLKNKDEVVAILDEAGVKEIDAMYMPRAAIKRYNERAGNQMLENAQKLVEGIMQKGGDAETVGPVEQYNPQAEMQQIQQEMAPLGNKRYFKPDDLGKKTWAELLADFEWENIRVEITNENVDKQHVLQTLSMVLQTVAQNPMILQDPNAKLVFNKILTETEVISPLELTATQAAPQPQNPQQPAAAPPPLGAQPPMVKPAVEHAAPLIGG